MIITIKGIVRYLRKQRARRLEHKALSCEISEIQQNHQGNYDSYPFEFLYFKYGISQSRYLIKNWVQLYANCLTRSSCTILRYAGQRDCRALPYITFFCKLYKKQGVKQLRIIMNERKQRKWQKMMHIPLMKGLSQRPMATNRHPKRFCGFMKIVLASILP